MPLSPRIPLTAVSAEAQAAKDKVISAIRAAMPTPPARVGVAVSGGSDSLALLVCVVEAFRDQDVSVAVATVDHGLRREAAEEARAVGCFAQNMGLDHSVLTWEDPDGVGNLQGRARMARYRLLSDWAHQNQIPMVLLGHTADDQAETVLMRLRREAGVNGLAGIPDRRMVDGIEFRRPLLGIRREELRDVLKSDGIGWIEDPSNNNEQFERVRTRKALAVLETLGVSPTAFSAVAENLTQARKALEWYSFLAARDVLSVDCGAVAISRRAFRVLPAEIAHRLVAGSVRWLTGSDYSPRRQAMVEAQQVVKGGGSHTFAGCRVLVKDDLAWMFREHNALRNCECAPGQPWDARWLLYGGAAENQKVRALGDAGLQHCANWRDLGVPREVLKSTPGVWLGDELIAAPTAGFENGWCATLTRCEEALYTSFLTH